MQYYKHTVRRPVSAPMGHTEPTFSKQEPNSALEIPGNTVSSNPLTGFPLAMAYVPYQSFEELNEPDKALECGTLFKELYLPFYGQKRRNGI